MDPTLYSFPTEVGEFINSFAEDQEFRLETIQEGGNASSIPTLWHLCEETMDIWDKENDPSKFTDYLQLLRHLHSFYLTNKNELAEQLFSYLKTGNLSGVQDSDLKTAIEIKNYDASIFLD